MDFGRCVERPHEALCPVRAPDSPGRCAALHGARKHVVLRSRWPLHCVPLGSAQHPEVTARHRGLIRLYKSFTL